MKHCKKFFPIWKMTLTFVSLIIICLSASAQVKPIKRPFLPGNAVIKNFQLKKLQLLKRNIPVQALSGNISNLPTQKITVTNSPLYPTPQKPAVAPISVNANCDALPVSYKTSMPELALIFPPSNLVGKIYPGAIYTFDEIKNFSFTPYTAYSDRNPMSLNTTIFSTNTSISTKDVTTFDYGTLLGTWNEILRGNIAGSTPGNVYSEVILAESASQLKTDLNTFSSVDVGVKLSVPIPDIPVTVSAGEKVTVTNTSQITNSSERQKNSVVIRYNQVFYSSILTPKEGLFPMFKTTNPASLPNDLMYISSVDYGQVFYIVLTSTLTKDQLFKAIHQKVSTKSELGAQVEGIPVELDIAVGTENENSQQTQNLITAENTSISVFQQGGAVQPVTGRTVDEVLDNMKNIQTRFSATNLGAPIKFTLNYVKDHALAYVNYNLAYGTSNCGEKIANKFDVKIELEDFKLNKVGEADGTQELFGSMKIINLKAGNKTAGSKVFWSQARADAKEKVFREGTVLQGKEEVMLQDLTLEQLLNLEIAVGGSLTDLDEWLGNVYEFKCVDCINQDGDLGQKTKISELGISKNSINSMIANGQWQPIKFGSDYLLVVNYYKSGKKEDGHLSTRWKVWVKPK